MNLRVCDGEPIELPRPHRGDEAPDKIAAAVIAAMASTADNSHQAPNA